MTCAVQPSDIKATRCETRFSLEQLKSFLDASRNGEDTCPALATKYLGIPKPSPEEADNFPQYLCGGGAAPGSTALILGAIGFIAARRRRHRPAAVDATGDPITGPHPRGRGAPAP
jgi:MYXO-CTERM domain-containing protein